jgi:ferric enterobactin receptor
MKSIRILFCLVLIAAGASAQGVKGRITGKVIDAVTKQPVDFATVSVFKQGSASPFDGISSDSTGRFVVKPIDTGNYKVTIDFLGYQKKTFDHVIVTSASPAISLGDILLSPTANQLKGVTITAKTPAVQNKIDMMVYNPQNDLTLQGGVALDVLKKVPMISVDIDGNVELEGNSDIRFLINGKPSSIFGASLADALQTIPASQIERIEVITNPGAKYDAEGTGGIINIVLKENKVQGINGSVNLSAGTRLENGSFNLAVRKGNFGVNAFFSGNEQLNSTTRTNNQRTSTSGDTTSKLLEEGSSAFKRAGYQSGINFDWNISKHDELIATFNYNHFGNSSSGLLDERNLATTPAGTASNVLSTVSSASKIQSNSPDVSLSYKKTFAKKDEELDFLVNSSFGSNSSNSSQQTIYTTPGFVNAGQQSVNPGTDRETDISLDYSDPFGKGFTLETGAKATIEDISNSLATDTLTFANGGYGFIPNANQTYAFKYDRNIFAYYLSGSFQLFHDFLDGKAGLRYEYTTTTDNFQGADIPNYGILAPSFVLQHKIDQAQSVKLSYSYRLQRPNYSALNPFYNISDPHNISVGNPDLHAELGHNFELTYNNAFNGGANLFISAFYRYNTNDIQSYTTYYTNYSADGGQYSDVSLTRQSNVGTVTNEGINFFVSIPITSKFNLRSNMMFANKISTDPGGDGIPAEPTVNGFAYRLNLNASYEFANNYAAEIFGNYRSSQRTVQGTNPAFGFYNIAIRKQFMHKNASIGLTAANPFNQYISQTSTTTGSNFTQVYNREVPFRSFGISLSYKFGKLEFKKEKPENQDNQDQENQNQMPGTPAPAAPTGGGTK